MLAVTGSTGQLGRLILPHLLKSLPASSIALSVRDLNKATTLSGRGLRVRKADYADPASLAHAWEGCDRLLLISADKIGDEAFALHKSAIDAAKDAGVRKIFYTSQISAGPETPVVFGQDHYRTEQYLEQSGLDFTSFRNGFYMASCKHMLGGAEHTGVIAVPKDGKNSWTAHADLAEAAAKLIVADIERTPSDRYIYLTNTQKWDMEDVAEVVGRIVGRDVKRVVVAPEDYVKTLVGHGVPEGMATMFLGAWKASETGELGRIDPTLRELLGREPITIEQGLRELLKSQTS